MSKRNWLAVALTPAMALALILGACGSESSASSDDDNPPATVDIVGTLEKGLAVPEGAPFVDQDNLKFKPTALTVAVGDKVYFKNSESAIHTVTIEGQDASGTMRNDDVYVWTTNSTGTFDITCDYHPQMKARITVE